MKTAVFLGAGASRAFGFALTSDILPRMRKGLQDDSLFGAGQREKELHKQLRTFLSSLLPGMFLRKDSNERGEYLITDGELPLITEVLSLVDYSILSSTTSARYDRSRDQLVEVRRLIERAIVAILQTPYNASNVPEPLTRLVNWLYRLDEETPGGVSLISTNYDISVEQELFKKFLPPAPEPVDACLLEPALSLRQSLHTQQATGDEPGAKRPEHTLAETFDFGFEWRNPYPERRIVRPQEPNFKLYKLHGSLNFLRCPLCDHIYINVYGSIIYQAFRETIDSQNTCDCSYAPLEPVLVAPSTIRDIRDSNLLEIWRHACEALRTSNRWVIIGYSFPGEDVAIRSMFIRAFREQCVEIVQRSQDAKTEARYRVLFPQCKYLPGGLEKFVEYL